MTEVEILAHGPPSVILLSEAKRFTIYSNSVKTSPRFKRIVESFHTQVESLRTVRSLLTAIRNFETSNSGRDQITEERRQNTNWHKDLKSYLDIIQKRDLDFSGTAIPAQEKSASFTFTDKASTARSRTDTERSDASGSLQSRSRTDTELTILCNPETSLRSEMETFRNVLTTLLAKPIGHGNAKAARR